MAEPLHRYDLDGLDNAPDVTITWTEDDQKAALAEGWYLDEDDAAIQANRDPDVFVFDCLAQDHIRDRARLGSELHLRAMILDAWAALGAWEYQYRAVTKKDRWHAE